MSESEALPTFFDPSTCVRKGLCPVTRLRGQSETVESHSLYFEQHGSGPEKVVFIMGLNSSSFSWSDQVKHFARTGTHSALVFDNRGVGNSGVPRGPYTTKGMAEDVVVLLDFLGWKEDLHVVGISLGGMVAQELATQIPDRIVSLVLCVTKAGELSWNGFTPWKGMSTILRLMTITDVDVKVPMILGMVFPDRWLDAQDPDDPEGRTNRQVQTDIYKHRAEVTRPQTLLGSISQISAGITHRLTPARLRSIAASIPKVLIVTGDDDNLINPSNSRDLAARMPGSELVIWEGTGHALHAQWPKRFNELLERAFREGKERFEARKQAGSV